MYKTLSHNIPFLIDAQEMVGALSVATLAALLPAVTEMERAADAGAEEEASPAPGQGSPKRPRHADGGRPRGRDTAGRSDAENEAADPDGEPLP